MGSKANIGAKITLEGEKEYRQAITEINKAQSVLKSELKAVSAEFLGNANSIDALKAKNTILIKQQEEQEKRLQTLRGALESANKQYGEGSTQAQNWQIKLNNAYADLTKLDRELGDNKKYLDEAKASTNGTAKSIDNFGKEITSVKDDTLKFGDVLKANLASQAIIEGVKGLGNAVKNVAQGVVDLATNAAAYADDMMTMSTQTGISTDKLQAYNYMAELTDVSLEDMTKSMAKNIKSMSNAQNGSEKYADAYKRLKVEVTDGNGKLRDSEEVYWDVIDALKGVTDQTERDSISMQLFGKSAQELNPLIVQGSEGVAKFTKEAENMGAVLDEKTLDSLGKADDAFQRLTQAGEIAKRKIGVEMAPAFTEAADKITDKVTDMDGSFANFAGGALNLTVDGLGWVMDNAGLIAGGISGIATGMAVFKAGSAIQTGMDLAIKGWQAYKTATEGATVAQYALNVAQNLSPVGVMATAVGALTAGYILYRVAIKNTKSELELYNDKCEENLKVSKSLNQTIKDNINVRQSNTEEIKSQYGAASVLSDKLFDLAEKENLSNKEKAEMAALVDELNTSIPGLGLTIDLETGLLNKQRGEIDGLITSNLELAKVKAAQADLTKIAQDQYDAEKKLTDLKEQEKEQTEKLNQATKEWTGNNEGAKIANHKLKEQLEKTKDEIASTEENVSDLGNEWNTASGYIRDHSSIDGTTKAINNFGGTVEDAGNQTVTSNEEAQAAIKELTDTYKQAVKDRTADIKSAMGLFDDFALDTSISGKKLMKNLKDQVDGMKDWAENLKSLAKKGIDDGLLKELEDMGPSAASQIAALNQLSEPELKKYSDMWKEKSKLARKQAVEELSGLKEDTDKKIDELTKSVETKLYNSGKNSADGYAEGFKKEHPYMTTTMTNLFDDAVAEVNSKLGIHSPSTVFEKMGIHSIEGYVGGVKNSKDMIGKSMDEISEEILSKARQTLDNYKVYHKMSTQEEIEYWDGIRKQCKKGTQARIDADKEYLDAKKKAKEEEKELNDSILSDAEKYLENYKVWHKMSLQEEIDYWDKIRKQLKKGTQARLDADKEYLEAKEKQAEAEKELLEKQNETEEEYKDNCKKVQEDLVNDVQAANDKYNEAVESRTKAITGAMGLFDAFTAKDVNGTDLIKNLQSQVDGLVSWENNLQSLKAKGIDSALLSELEEMGPSAAGEIDALNKLSAGELNTYVDLWKDKSRLAKEQAIGELSGLKDETLREIEQLNKQANQSLSEYYNVYKTAMNELGIAVMEPIEKLKVTVTEDGKIIVFNMTDAMEKMIKSKETADKLKTINDTITSSLRSMADKAKEIGVLISKGLIDGMMTQNPSSSLSSLLNAGALISHGVQSALSTTQSIQKEITSGSTTSLEYSKSVAQRSSGLSSADIGTIGKIITTAVNNISGDVILQIGNEDIARANKKGTMSLSRRGIITTDI